jgi:hypothetical protein
VLREVNVESCESADNGARALFEVIQESKSIRKVTVKNNLIRDGLCIQKAIAANPQIYLLNVNYNDIPFKVCSEIHNQVANNYRTRKNGQEVKTEEELGIMRRTQADLIFQQKGDQATALRAELQLLRISHSRQMRVTRNSVKRQTGWDRL